MQKFDDEYSYLCVYVGDDLVEYVVNTHEKNKQYQETFKDIQHALEDKGPEDAQPFEFILADSQTGNLAVRLTGQMLADLELVEMDLGMAQHRHPELFQPDDIS